MQASRGVRSVGRLGHRLLGQTAGAIDLAGVYPPIITPFEHDESISWQMLRNNMQKWNSLGFRGYVVMGSNGEAAYLTQKEKLELTERVREWSNPEHLIIAGCGLESTTATIGLAKELAQAGADAVLVLTPCFYKASMTAEALQQHFIHVADHSPVPIILYNVPANTGVELPIQVALQLAEHPNCIGIKDSGGDIAKITRLVAETPDGFQVLCGSAGFFLPGLQMGSVGCVAASANCLGAEVVQLQTEFTQAGGCSAAAIELQARLVAPNAAVTREFGVAGLKHAMALLGYEPGQLRSPLLPLNEQQKQQVLNAFKKSKFM